IFLCSLSGFRQAVESSSFCHWAVLVKCATHCCFRHVADE
ncbi:hypothetical protein BVRB_033210, partial [Beta vulgaris subsp. vulgaris]